MYILNGLALDNAGMDWTVQQSSRVRSAFERARASLRVAGRDGVVGGLAAVVDPPVHRLVVETPPANLESLLALVGDSGVLAEGGREVAYETVSTEPEDLETASERVSVTITLRLTGVFWRDKAVSTDTVPLTSVSAFLDVWPGMSAPVPDSMVRVKGAATGIRVADAGGSWVTLPDVTASQYVRFESDTGKAFITTSDTWVGGTDVSGLVDFGGPRGVFEVTPVLAALQPSSRKGILTVSTVSRSGAVLAVRGKAAYAL